MTIITRTWHALAPKLIAFAATGLSSSALIGILAAFHVSISAQLSIILVGGLSSVAAFVQRDSLLDLPFAQLSLKVAVFIVTSASATGVVALVQQFGLDLTPWSWLIGALLTILATVLGYAVADQAPTPADPNQPAAGVPPPTGTGA